MKFRKMPDVVDAVQVQGQFQTRLEPWLINHPDIICKGDHLIIKTPEGDRRADLGDWIIRGVNGELYPCKPDIFSKTHEPA